MRAWVGPLALFMSAIVGLTGSANPSAAPKSPKLPPVIAVGFVGGFEIAARSARLSFRKPPAWTKQFQRSTAWAL